MMEDSINEKLIDKLKTYSSTLNYDTELLRTAAAKLHSRVVSQDKQIREKTLFQIRRKKENALQILLTVLDLIDDEIAAASIAAVIRESISPKSGISRFSVIRQLAELNASQNLIKLLIQQEQILKESGHTYEPLLHEIIWILSHISQKDPKFVSKIRQLNALPTFNMYLKFFHQHNSKLIVPLLMVIKCLAKNGNFLTALIRDGISLNLEKLFLTISLTPSSKLKLLLCIFSYLSKSTQFCNRMIKMSIVPIFLKIFSRWEKYNGKTKLKICTDTVVILQHICLTKLGRSVIRRENGFTPLYKFCISCPEDKVYDRLLAKVCSIINVCLQKKELPLCSILSPIQFSLPVDLKKNCYDTIDSDDSDNDEMDNSYINGKDEEKSLNSKLKLDANETASVKSLEPTLYRNISDLQMYRKMFAEYYFLYYNGKHDSESTVIRLQGLKRDIWESNENIFQESSDSAGSDKNSTENFEKSLPILEDLNSRTISQRLTYCKIASQVNSVIPFAKVAYPDMMGGDGIGVLQPFYTRDRKVYRNDQTLFASIDALNASSNYQTRFLKNSLYKRSKLVNGVDRYITEDKMYNNVVYDLDKLLKPYVCERGRIIKRLSNDDETRIGVKEYATSTLNFESRFESGNLRKAIQVGPREYDLILSPDVNSSNHCQWFYFEVSNMDNIAPYTFNIINCEKTNSQFNYGMKPIMYSVREATLGRPGWFRTGTDICYSRNGYKMPHNHTKTFLTASFNIKFHHSLDVCYVAYTFPYTYSQLMYRIRDWTLLAKKNNIYMRTNDLCSSLNENSVPLLTITAADCKENQIADREIIFLTSRVHPGEANSSWVIDGSISHLLTSSSPSTIKLRNQYVFKIVPMLNIEGVINGCHRCGLTDEDLNRKWNRPDRVLHPSIFHTKGLLEYCARVLRKSPFVFCDFHGHSRKKNVFFFGCSNLESWLGTDQNLPNVGIEHLLLPNLMENCSPAFSSELCKYRVERNRESTARVTVWREFGVRKSYTMETTYCGCDQGPYKGFHLDTNHLREIGSNFCTALTNLYDERKLRIEMLLVKQDGNRYIYSSSSHISSNNVQNKMVPSSAANSQTKLIPPVSPVWNARMIATNQKKITSLVTQAKAVSTQVNTKKFYTLMSITKI